MPTVLPTAVSTVPTQQPTALPTFLSRQDTIELPTQLSGRPRPGQARQMVNGDAPEVPMVPAAGPGRTALMADGPASPTEMPVPTDVPSPTSPQRREVPTLAVPTLAVPTLAVPTVAPTRSSAPTLVSQLPNRGAQAPGTPTFMPVPTDVPSPTSPAALLGEEEFEHGAPTSPVSVLAEEQWLSGPPGMKLRSQAAERGRSRASKRQRQLSPESVSPRDIGYTSAAGKQTLLGQSQALARRAAPGTPEMQSRRQPTTPTRRGWGAPPTPTGRQPGTPTPGTPTEDVAPLTPKDAGNLRLSVARGSSVDRGSASPMYIMEGRAEVPLPPTPTYTGDSPAYLDENEPPTPTLEADDDELYGNDSLSALGMVPDVALPSLLRDPATSSTDGPPLDVVLAALPGGGVPGAPGGLTALQVARHLAAAGAKVPPVPAAPLRATASGGPPEEDTSREVPPLPYVRLPGMESPTPTYETDEDSEFEDIEEEEEEAEVPAGAASSAAPQAEMPPLASEVFPELAKRRRRGTVSSDEELPPWKRRERRKTQQ